MWRECTFLEACHGLCEMKTHPVSVFWKQKEEKWKSKKYILYNM